MTKINYRNSFLALVSLGIGLATVYTIVQPKVGNRQVAYFPFPDRIPLKSWQLIKTEPIKYIEAGDKEEPHEYVMASAKNYFYQKDDATLTAEMRYIVGTRGNVQSLLEAQANIPQEIFAQAELKNLKNVGFHSLFIYQDKAYLSSCINSRGKTTVSPHQFSRNRYIHDFNPSILVHWLLNKETIRDSRCLLVNLSLPINTISTEKAYQLLQDTWQDWYQWWQPNFPGI